MTVVAERWFPLPTDAPLAYRGRTVLSDRRDISVIA